MKKTSAKQGKPIPFQKLHGAGNDILVLLSQDLPKKGKPALLKSFAHRQTGIGCDQIVEVLSTKPLAIQIWNADGSQAEMCANGSRVLLYLAAKEGWIAESKKEVPLTISGKDYVARKKGEGYELCLGEPLVFSLKTLPLGLQLIPYYEVNVGNPHAVILATGKDGWALPRDYSLQNYGPKIETHPRFPKKTNVQIVRSWRKKGKAVEAMVDVWERGAGATLSCGSGAVAVAAVMRKLTGASAVKIKMTEYTLEVRFEGEQAYLTGPSALVAKGILVRAGE